MITEEVKPQHFYRLKAFGMEKFAQSPFYPAHFHVIAVALKYGWLNASN